MSQGKHGPNRLDRYRTIHETVMDQYRDQGFILSDSLEFRDQGGGVILLEGRVDCAFGLYVDVFKALEILDGDGPTAMVQTFDYSYNAVLAGVGNIFRYCAPHDDHNQEHHVHRYDVLAGDRHGDVTFITDESERPTLGEVFEELRGWASDHAAELAALRGD